MCDMTTDELLSEQHNRLVEKMAEFGVESGAADVHRSWDWLRRQARLWTLSPESLQCIIAAFNKAYESIAHGDWSPVRALSQSARMIARTERRRSRRRHLKKDAVKAAAKSMNQKKVAAEVK